MSNLDASEILMSDGRGVGENPRRSNGMRGGAPSYPSLRPSMFDPFQVFLSAGIAVRQHEGGAVFFGGSATVSLLFE